MEIEAGHLLQGDQGNPQAAKGDGSGVGDQRETTGLEWGKSELQKEGCRNGNGSTKTGGTFDEGSKAEGDQDHLHPWVGDQSGQLTAQGVKSTGNNGQAMEKQDVDDDPADGEEGISNAVADRANG